MADTEQVVVETEDGGVTTAATSPSSPLSPSCPSSSPPSSPFHFTMTDLSGPLLRSLNAGASCRRRLRYTCSDVSPNVTPVLEAPARYLALGTTSGSVHVFQYFGCGDDAADSALQCLKNLRVDDHHHLTAPVVNGQTTSTTTATTSIQHYLTIIHEDLIGPVTSVAFAPVQLVVSRNNAQTNLFTNGNGLSTSTSTSSGDDSSSSDLDSSSNLSEQYSSPPAPQLATNNEHRHHPQQTSHHSLYNLVLAIGSSKGSLLIVDIDLQFQQQQKQKSRQQKNKGNSSISTTSTSSPSFFSSSKSGSSSLHLLATRRWAVTYQSSSFTAGQAISLLRWDNSSR